MNHCDLCDHDYLDEYKDYGVGCTCQLTIDQYGELWKNKVRDAIKHVAPIIYNERLPKLREVARMHGYALAVHGSQIRDFDLIAIPWIENCSSSETLAEAIWAAITGHSTTMSELEQKSHGRIAYTFYFHDERASRALCIDLSITPQAHIP